MLSRLDSHGHSPHTGSYLFTPVACRNRISSGKLLLGHCYEYQCKQPEQESDQEA